MPELYNYGGRLSLWLHHSLLNAVLAALVCKIVPLDALDADASKYYNRICKRKFLSYVQLARSIQYFPCTADFFSPASFGLIHIEMTDAACSTLSSMRIRTSEFYEAAQEIDREISLDGTPANFSIPLTDLLPSTSYEASLQFSRNDCFSEPSTIIFQLADRGASSARVLNLGTFSIQKQSVEQSLPSLIELEGRRQEAGDGNGSHDQSCGDCLPKADRTLFRCAYYSVTVLVAVVALVLI